MRLSLSAALLLASSGALGKERLAPGDQANAKPLWRLHCAGCHGAAGEPTKLGASLGASSLRDPALVDGRSDEQLISAIQKGGPGAMPAFKFLTPLDAADLAALLRAPVPAVADVFGDAAAYTYKRYALLPAQVARAEALAGALPPSERELTVFSIYGGDKPQLGPRVVAPDDHVGLDDLSPKSKIGYLAFGTVPAAPPASGEAVVALALTPAFCVARVVSGGDADLSGLAAAALGRGGRDPASRRPFVYKKSPEQAAALTRLYARAVEAAAAAAKDEADRHLFDPPESAAKKAPPTNPDE